MEEEVGIKVTRLRRRLSVEAEDVKSPSTQSTPTKKRGGRLAAKPQLELIDENAPEAAPKRTRKSTAREIADPEPEKVVTPSRRSARVRSNTSIVSETPSDLPEDKGTPSRRSTRIKSNTSILSETVNVNSPRAKRAIRRTSQVGSDNEAPVTPARQTRRTRKDSTSSIDKPVEPNAGKLGSQVSEVIVEESETNVKETKSTESPKRDSPAPRKSPRLIGKSGRKSSSLDNNDKGNEPQSDKEAMESTPAAEKSLSEPNSEQTKEVIDQESSEQNNLSVASKNLITELEDAPTKGKKSLNKSATAVEEPQTKSKRNRTKSWTTISVEPSHESNFCSDSEASKKKNKNKNYTLNLSNISGSGDGIMISNKNDTEQEDSSLNSSTLSNKKKNKRHELSMTVETETAVNNVSILSSSINKSAIKMSENDVSKNVSKDVNALNSSKNRDSSTTEKFFEQEPVGVIKSLVFIEDSDSNSVGKENNDKDLNSGDQCVPVVDHQLVNDNKPGTQQNLSYEPMDIDETMPDNVSLAFADKNNSVTNESQETESEKKISIFKFSQVKNDSMNKSKRKSVNRVSENSIHEGINKSQRKSSITDNYLEETNKSKRKSSLSNGVSEDTTDGILSQSSNRKSIDNVDKLDKSINKSKRNSNMSTEQNNEADYNDSGMKSLIADTTLDDASINKGANKSKRKSSISNIISDDKTNEGSNKSTRKSTILDLANDENMDNTLNKSKRKSVMTSFTVADVSTIDMKPSVLDQNNADDTINKSSNKSKRKSLISNNDTMNKSRNKSISLDKTDNENKSTLVLSQIKDVTETEVNLELNVPKDNNDSNDQLSKTVNVPNVITEKDTDKKNLSLTYSTSTPLQQKSMKKLGLQINSSIIAPSSVNKIEKTDKLSKSKIESSTLSQKIDSESSEEEEDSEQEEFSVEKSNLIDDEAEEASDDYESGDSRDDDEREYEEQNEIVEKGETLDSDEEEDYSDDSDYEKGSFIVSSDNEDNELLSGSGDDLDMSPDELTMSAKSKKKFNERKIKEQKKASREMFEARHKLDELSSKSKSKKNNRQRLDSSSSESDEEVVAQPKKNRRQRIDSSQDISTVQSDGDKSLSKKKKAKRLSVSVCEENEKEVSIREETQTDEIQQDPLALQDIIKEEPKTPQKALDISTVSVTNMDEVEEVNVDENVSIMKPNQTSDPLQATIAENNEDDDSNDDSISENEEITQNYESVLNNLNKSGSKKIKSADMSLDLNKKTKQKAKEPIVDQLNLTQVKKSKQKKADATETKVEPKNLDKSLGNKNTDKEDKQPHTYFEGSSDSIDMKLLFPEDSNDSGMIMDDKKQDKKTEDVQEDFIPLKRSQAKTNILENTDMSLNKSKDESLLNVSGKKKNKRKSSKTEVDLVTDTQDENLSFFVDTTGTLSEANNVDVNTSIKNSAKKNKQKNNVSFANIEEAAVDDNENDAPLEVSYRSDRNKPKQDLNTQNNEATQAENTVGTPNQSAKKKKKNKKGLNTSQNAETTMIDNEDNGASADIVQNISLGSAKKAKQKVVPDITVETKNVNKDNEDVTKQEQNTKKRKRKSSANQTIDEIIIKDDLTLTKGEPLTTNNKKKRKITNNDEDIIAQVEDFVTEAQQEKPPVENTKKKSKELQHQEVDKIGDEITKKNKKRKERDDDDASKISKVLKQNSFDKVHVPRLPSNVLKQLDDKPKTKHVIEAKKTNVIATSSFVVEETKKRRNKPSNYLEESVYLNDDMDQKKQKGSIKNPKVLPFMPTASISGSGFTTNFKVNIIPQHTEFVAQSRDVLNFKNDYLHKKRIKKLGTFEMYKRQRNIKISKF